MDLPARPAHNALPPGDVYLITHSHGGNVALGATQFYTDRPVQRIINLATPVNFDIRYSNAPWASHMCTASSWDDWVQFFGASPYQVYSFMEQSYYGYQYGYMSTEAFINGNYSDAAYYAYLAYDYIMAGYSWFESTKLELWGDQFQRSDKVELGACESVCHMLPPCKRTCVNAVLQVN